MADTKKKAKKYFEYAKYTDESRRLHEQVKGEPENLSAEERVKISNKDVGKTKSFAEYVEDSNVENRAKTVKKYGVFTK